MFSKLSALLTALVVGLAPLPTLAQAALAGLWEITLQTPQGANTVGLTLKQDGDKVTGDLTSPLGSVPISGTTTGNDVAMTATIELQGMSMQLGLKGKLEGETFNGMVAFGDFGEFAFTGKRGVATPSAAAASTAASPKTPAAGGSDASGKWNITLKMGPAGEFPLTADLKQEGQNVTGTFSSQAGDVPVKGTMTGPSLKLEFTAETPQGPLPITITGDLTDAGFAGKASLAGLGEAEWVGVRSK
jgi:hypothetical protein